MTSAGTKTTQVFRVYIPKRARKLVWDGNNQARGMGLNATADGGGPEHDPQQNRGLTVCSRRRKMKAASIAMGYPAPEVAVDGEVLEADEPHKLVLTWRMVMGTAVLAAEGFTRLTYEIEEVSGLTKLTVVHDLEGAPQLAQLVAGEWEVNGAGGGWPWILSGLKTLLETGTEMVHGF